MSSNPNTKLTQLNTKDANYKPNTNIKVDSDSHQRWQLINLGKQASMQLNLIYGVPRPTLSHTPTDITKDFAKTENIVNILIRSKFGILGPFPARSLFTYVIRLKKVVLLSQKFQHNG